jgi:hypothetical protein
MSQPVTSGSLTLQGLPRLRPVTGVPAQVAGYVRAGLVGMEVI